MTKFFEVFGFSGGLRLLIFAPIMTIVVVGALVWSVYEMIMAEPLIAGGTIGGIALVAIALTAALVLTNRAKKRRWAALSDGSPEA